jgi:hypothetical protein
MGRVDFRKAGVIASHIARQIVTAVMSINLALIILTTQAPS